MALTSQLGTKDARLGNIELGEGIPATIFTGSASDTISFSDAMAGHNLHQTITQTLTFTDGMSGFAVRGEAVDTLTFSEVLFRNITVTKPITDTLTFSEGLIHTIFATCTDTLTFSDDTTGGRYTSGFPTDSVTFSETMALQLSAGRHIFEQLTLVEALTKNVLFLKMISETLTFSETMTGKNVKIARDILTFADNLTVFVAKLLKDTLDFDSIFTLNANFGRLTADVLVLFDRIAVQLYMRLNLADTVNFTDVMTANRVTPIYDSFSFSETLTETSSKFVPDSLTFLDLLTTNKVLNVPLSDTMLFTDIANVKLVISALISDSLTLLEALKVVHVKFGSATDTLTLSDLLVREVIAVSLDTSLTFTDTLVKQKIGVRNPSDTLTFSDSIFVNIVAHRTLTDTLTFVEAPPADILPPSAISIPNPGPTTVGVYGTVFGKMMTFIGQTMSVVITPPEFNDFLTDRNQTIFKRRMDGSVSTFIKTCSDEKLHYEFIVSKPKADEFRAFLDAENGRAFTIYDWNGYVWIAKLLTDTIDKTEVGRWEPCGNKTHITVEFLGRRYA